MILCPKHYQQIKTYGYIPDKDSEIIGLKFNKLTIKNRERCNDGRSGWLCECECGNTIIARLDWLRNGNVKTCGHCSYNTYEFIEDYVKTTGKNGLVFYFDLVDYDRVSKHTWRVHKKTKRVYATINKETVELHKFITNTDKTQIVDHIDGDPSNNRRYNLRYCTTQENSCNLKVKNNNTSGITGVWYDNSRDSWVAEIKINQGKIAKRCGSFISAVILRIKMEVQYFGEFRSFRNDKHIRKVLNKYGFNLDDLLKKEAKQN